MDVIVTLVVGDPLYDGVVVNVYRKLTAWFVEVLFQYFDRCHYGEGP